MLNNSTLNTIALIATVVVLLLALGLFAFANGFADARLAIAFVLQAALAAALLLHIFKYSKSEPTAPRETSLPEQAMRRIAKERACAAETPASDAAAGMMSATAEELRTSVEVMQEELEELLDEDVPADKEHMESLYQETDRLRKIIDGMEQMAQAQALAGSLKKEPVQIEPLLQEVVQKTRIAVPDKDINYAVECDSALIMTGDAECIARIIGNIADNAAKAVRGTGNVVLSASRSGEEMVFSVRDTGTGIRRAHLGHIYERFFRGTGSGVGMGLAVVKELVDACGGKIDVETAAGKGTTFTVKLPAP